MRPQKTSPIALLVAALAALPLSSTVAEAQVTAIRAGGLVDPATGTLDQNQIILVEDGVFTAVGPNVAIPPGVEVIDLSDLTVVPGLVDAHNHLALTYKDEPESNVYYLTYVLDSTPLRAIQAASNGMQMLSAGFTIVRDMGNNGKFADTALRVAIEQGWIPGPTIINSGIIIGGMGGQFWPTPEMGVDKDLVYPEYLDADTRDEIVKAVRTTLCTGRQSSRSAWTVSRGRTRRTRSDSSSVRPRKPDSRSRVTCRPWTERAAPSKQASGRLPTTAA